LPDDASTSTFIAFVSLNTTHHFDLFTLSQISSGCPCTPDEVETLYVVGVINNSDPVSFDETLRFRATSHAIVKMMQRTKVDRLLRVLFDSGADKTMLKRSVFNPSSGQQRKVTGVTLALIMNKEVMMSQDPSAL
jgi:hypothetical protein